MVSYEPVGPCYLISPWNFPIAMFGRKVGPALTAGREALKLAIAAEESARTGKTVKL